MVWMEARASLAALDPRVSVDHQERTELLVLRDHVDCPARGDVAAAPDLLELVVLTVPLAPPDPRAPLEALVSPASPEALETRVRSAPLVLSEPVDSRDQRESPALAEASDLQALPVLEAPTELRDPKDLRETRDLPVAPECPDLVGPSGPPARPAQLDPEAFRASPECRDSRARAVPRERREPQGPRAPPAQAERKARTAVAASLAPLDQLVPLARGELRAVAECQDLAATPDRSECPASVGRPALLEPRDLKEDLDALETPEFLEPGVPLGVPEQLVPRESLASLAPWEEMVVLAPQAPLEFEVFPAPTDSQGPQEALARLASPATGALPVPQGHVGLLARMVRAAPLVWQVPRALWVPVVSVALLVFLEHRAFPDPQGRMESWVAPAAWEVLVTGVVLDLLVPGERLESPGNVEPQVPQVPQAPEERLDLQGQTEERVRLALQAQPEELAARA